MLGLDFSKNNLREGDAFNVQRYIKVYSGWGK
jgi:hypothetical protein